MLLSTTVRQPAWLSFLAYQPLTAWAHFEPGDHVRVDRGLYWHHAIFIGNGILIEFGSGVAGGSVSYVRWDDFAKGATVEFVGRGGTVAVQRATSQMGRSDFSILDRNCEHFANWCATGRWESGQVDALAKGAVISAGLALLVVVLKKAA